MNSFCNRHKLRHVKVGLINVCYVCCAMKKVMFSKEKKIKNNFKGGQSLNYDYILFDIYKLRVYRVLP